jgi:hypothetical protein
MIMTIGTRPANPPIWISVSSKEPPILSAFSCHNNLLHLEKDKTESYPVVVRIAGAPLIQTLYHKRDV